MIHVGSEGYPGLWPQVMQGVSENKDLVGDLYMDYI